MAKLLGLLLVFVCGVAGAFVGSLLERVVWERFFEKDGAL